MAEQGQYEKLPRTESITWMRDVLMQRDNVLRVSVRNEQIFEIERKAQVPVTMYLTNQYTIGEADVREILSEHPDIDCIACAVTYNQYTSAAHDEAKRNGIALFTTSEFLGAVNFQGGGFFDYVRPH